MVARAWKIRFVRLGEENRASWQREGVEKPFIRALVAICKRIKEGGEKKVQIEGSIQVEEDVQVEKGTVNVVQFDNVALG